MGKGEHSLRMGKGGGNGLAKLGRRGAVSTQMTEEGMRSVDVEQIK